MCICALFERYLSSRSAQSKHEKNPFNEYNLHEQRISIENNNAQGL